jgi:hypothetical protein
VLLLALLQVVQAWRQRFNRRVCQHCPFTHVVKEQKDVLSENDVLTPAEDLQRIQFLKEHPREL